MSLLPDVAVCLVCMKVVLDTEKGIQCEKECGRWFHSHCINVTDTEYRKLATDNKVKWFCNRVDCTKPNQHPLNQMFSRFDVVASQMALVLTKLDNLKDFPANIGAIKDELASVNEKLNNFEPRIADIEKRVETLEDHLKDLQTGNESGVGIESVLEEMSDRSRR
ncbi:hypothetical protein J6590_098751, partial [Homalodisca vitripennis]